MLEWMNEHELFTVTLFLTGHADFSYAQQAVRLGGYDYLLKPINYEHLKHVVARAVTEVQKRREQKQFNELYTSYEKLRETQQPLLTERFWQDVLSKRIQPASEAVKDLIMTCKVNLDPKGLVLPILLSVEYWFKEFTQRDEDILEYALRNAASEIIIGQEIKGDVIADRNGILFVMLYLPNGDANLRTELAGACERYIQACSRYFYCSVSCYLGEAVPIREATNVHYSLIEMEHANVTESGKVYNLTDYRDSTLAPGMLPTVSIDTDEWTLLLESGRKDELLGRMDALFEDESSSGIKPETLNALYHSLLGFIYQVAHNRGWSVKQLVGSSKWMDEGAATRSVSQYRIWSRKLVTMTAEYLQQNRNENSVLMEKVKAYIQSNLSTVTREEIASHVYLNSAYLSRLFKRETGQSLVEYIIGLKMKKAKLMLIETNIKIGDICDSLGYENFSHCARMFKKQVGMTPQEYRKRYQNVVK